MPGTTPAMTSPMDLLTLLGLEESERVEFKRGALGTRELAEYAVGMGNSGGGVLVLGVTDKQPREIRGLSEDGERQVMAARQGGLDATRVRIEVERREVEGKVTLLVRIPARPRGKLFHTADGKYLMRVGGSLVGMPEQEVERILREEAGALDWLAEMVPGRWQELVSLVEMERLRRLLKDNQRQELASLGDEALLAALELFRGSTRRLSRAGVLLVGTREAIREFVPYHELKLLRFGADELDPILNDDQRGSLLHCVELAEAAVAPVNTVESFQAGLFRVDLPRFPQIAWREALGNALVHRDYTVAGSVAVRLYEDRMEVGSPGGWVGGVSEATILHAEPRRRNELLAQVFQKIGLAERSAIGVKRMYRAMLLGGKPPPSFRATPGSVTVTLSSRTVDRTFSKLTSGPWGEDPGLSVVDLLALWEIQHQRRVRTEDIAPVLQVELARAKDILTSLLGRGLLDAAGVGRGRVWTLGPEATRRLGTLPGDAPVHTARIEAALLEELSEAGEHGLAAGEMKAGKGVGRSALGRILKRLVEGGRVAHSGKHGVGSRYWLKGSGPGEVP